jgi:hypothetical protein
MSRAPAQPSAISAAGSASGRRRLMEAASASGRPPNATARLVPKWSGSTWRPAWSAAALIVATASRASAGVSSEPSQPSARRPTRRSPAGADPPSQMSSGLAGSGPIDAPSTVKKEPWNVTSSPASISRSRVSASSNTAPR